MRERAAEELQRRGLADLNASKLVERALRVAESEFTHFTGTGECDWKKWLGDILQRVIDEESRQWSDRLRLALATLPTVQGQIVRLRHLNKWNLNRIAAHLGLDEATTAGLLRQGLHRLRSVIRHRDEA